jgi:hypothetical protein
MNSFRSSCTINHSKFESVFPELNSSSRRLTWPCWKGMRAALLSDTERCIPISLNFFTSLEISSYRIDSFVISAFAHVAFSESPGTIFRIVFASYVVNLSIQAASSIIFQVVTSTTPFGLTCCRIGSGNCCGLDPESPGTRVSGRRGGIPGHIFI